MKVWKISMSKLSLKYKPSNIIQIQCFSSDNTKKEKIWDKRMSNLWPSPYYIILKKESLLYFFFFYNTFLKILGIKAYPTFKKSHFTFTY